MKEAVEKAKKVLETADDVSALKSGYDDLSAVSQNFAQTLYNQQPASLLKKALALKIKLLLKREVEQVPMRRSPTKTLLTLNIRT